MHSESEVDRLCCDGSCQETGGPRLSLGQAQEGDDKERSRTVCVQFILTTFHL